MHYIEIDLAWAYANESGICVIADNGEIIYCESKLFSDEMIADIEDGIVEGSKDML